MIFKWQGAARYGREGKGRYGKVWQGMVRQGEER